VPTVIEALQYAADENPELLSYYEFQRELFELQDKARQEIGATLELADPEAIDHRLSRGLPLLSFNQLPIEPGAFAELAAALAEVVTGYYPDLDGQALPDAPADWIALARKRFTENGASPADEPSVIELAETASDLALKPYLVWAAQHVLPHIEQEAWQRRYCPICGGAPDLALLEADTGARRLVCGRCDSQWRYRRLGCAFCDTEDYSQIVYYPSEDEVYRLYVCQACQRYLKTLDQRKARGEISLPAERITSVDLDIIAREQGFR
jgi:FdhE protein